MKKRNYKRSKTKPAPELKALIRTNQLSIKLAQKNNPTLNDSSTGFSIQENTKPYVFIIDEINRGNISNLNP